MRTSLHGPYELGDTRVTGIATKGGAEEIRSETQKSYHKVRIGH